MHNKGDLIMWFIGFLSLLLIPIFIIFAIIALIRKREAKNYFIAAGFSVLVFGFAIIQSNKEEGTTEAFDKTQIEQEKKRKMSDEEIVRFKKYTAKTIKNHVFLKEAKIINGNKAQIDYASTAKVFKELSPESALTDEFILAAWKNGDMVNKVLMEAPLQVLREFPGLEEVQVNIPLEGKVHSINVSRKLVEKNFNINLDELHEDKSLDKWRTQVVDIYFNKKEREKYVQEFATVK